MAEPLANFQQQQYAFAAHLRNPELNPCPAGLEDRRVAIYRELFYNNLESLLAGNFPVIRKITADDVWHKLVRAFMTEHPSHTPLFPEIGREFHRFLENRAEKNAGDLPFLVELAHYEWMESAAMLSEASLDDAQYQSDGDVVSGVPIVSPLAWPMVYQYPVHRIRADFQPSQPDQQPTCLVIVRDKNDDVSFKQVNPMTMSVLEQIQNIPNRTGKRVIEELALSFPSEQRDSMQAAGEELLRGLQQRQIIVCLKTDKTE